MATSPGPQEVVSKTLAPITYNDALSDMENEVKAVSPLAFNPSTFSGEVSLDPLVSSAQPKVSVLVFILYFEKDGVRPHAVAWDAGNNFYKIPVAEFESPLATLTPIFISPSLFSGRPLSGASHSKIPTQIAGLEGFPRTSQITMIHPA